MEADPDEEEVEDAKKNRIIYTTIVSLLQINYIIRYCRNCGHLGFFGHGAPIHYHGGELIRGQILLTPILKPRQEPPLTRYPLYHTIHLLPQPPGKPFLNLVLRITYICLHHRPQQDLVPPNHALLMCGCVCVWGGW